MARERNPRTSRERGPPRWFYLVLLGVAGILGGLLLGELAAGNRLGNSAASKPSYADLSANPNAMPAASTELQDCFDCASNYGAAARLHAGRDAPADGAFRELGAVELDGPRAEPDDDYRYGGAFPHDERPSDTAFAASEGIGPVIPMESPVGSEEPPPTEQH